MSRAGGVPAGVAAMSSTRSTTLSATILLATAFGLTGCGFGGSEGASSVSGAPARKPAAADSEMVAAVSPSRTDAMVDMRFVIAKRPKVGEPVDVEVALTPSVQLERLFARFQAVEGLQIVSGGQTEQLENAPRGVAVGHKLTILPKQDGIFYITAVVVADSEKESVSRTFHIPLVAGEGLVAPPAAAPPAANVSESPRKPTGE
jgi:hypothetical protein